MIVNMSDCILLRYEMHTSGQKDETRLVTSCYTHEAAE